MAFRQGDMVSGIDVYGRPVSGVASSDGIGGYVFLTPSLRQEGGQWIQPAAVMVEAKGCSVIEPYETRQQSQQLRDQERAGQLATWARERDRSRER